MKPHEIAPHVVFAEEPVPWRRRFATDQVGERSAPAVLGPDAVPEWRGVTLAELLAETPNKSPTWLAHVYARLAVASSGPLLVGGAEAPGVSRLERAGWLRVAGDADLERARAAAWPALPMVAALELGMGSLAPDLVLVGEHDPYQRGLAMYSRGGVWLFRGLRELGYDELRVYVTNALGPKGRPRPEQLQDLHACFAPYDPTWLALGPVAHDVLTTAEIEHKAVVHPLRHRCNSFQAGPEGYSEEIRKAGVCDGPYADRQPVGAPANTWLAEELGIPLSVAYRKEHQPRPAGKSKVDDVKAAKARTMYVTGAVASLAEAAKALGVSAKGIAILAQTEGWDKERAKHLQDLREKTKAAVVQAEAKAAVQARRLAWSATVLSLRQIKANLKKGEFQASERGAKALGDLALELEARGDTQGDEERSRLQGLNPLELEAELRATVEAQFGPLPETTKRGTDPERMEGGGGNHGSAPGHEESESQPG